MMFFVLLCAPTEKYKQLSPIIDLLSLVFKGGCFVFTFDDAEIGELSWVDLTK